MHRSRLFLLCFLLGCPEPKKTPEKVEVPPPPVVEESFRFPAGAANPLTATTTPAPTSDFTLAEVTAEAYVESPLAFTELRVTVENRGSRKARGRVTLRMPRSGRLARFAVRTPDGWADAERLPPLAGRDPLHAPAQADVVPHARPEVWSAWVELAPGAQRELLLGYVESLAEPEYRLDLTGTAERTEATAFVRTSTGSRLVDRGVRVVVPAPNDALRHDGLLVTRASPVVRRSPDPVKSLLVLLDTSASRRADFEAELALLRSILSALEKGAGPSTPVFIACFDQDVKPVHQGPVSDLNEEAWRSIEDWGALGATDLNRALRWVAAQGAGAAHERLLLITDGRATTGEADEAVVLDAAKAVAAAGVKRIDVLAVGRADEALLEKVVRSGSRYGAVIDAGAPLEEIGARLGQAATSASIEVPGATATWPQVLSAPGVVFSRLAARRDPSLRIGTVKPIVLKPRSGTPALLEAAMDAPATLFRFPEPEEQVASKLAVEAGALVTQPASVHPVPGMELEAGGGPVPPPEAPKKKAMPKETSPVHGRLSEVMAAIAANDRDGAVDRAKAWHREAPDEPLAVIALIEAYGARNDLLLATRAVGSLVDMYPERADVLRHAAQRWDAMRYGPAAGMMLGALEKARRLRPHQPGGVRQYAYALAKVKREGEALSVIEKALDRIPEPRSQIVEVLRDDAALIGAAWLRREPSRKAEVVPRVLRLRRQLEQDPSVRFVLHWESDGTDADLIVEEKGGRTVRRLADVRNGYGPEVVLIRKRPRDRAYPYTVRVHHGALGPLGFGMGTLQTVEHDGRGGWWFASAPFVVTNEGAVLPLGKVDRPFGKRARP